MTPQIDIKHNIGNTIAIPNQFEIRAETYTSENNNIGATTIAVDNAIDFTASTILLLLGTMGAENSEIVVASSHTNQAFTVGATLLPHSRGESVAEMNYDQVVILKSTVINGMYSTLATLDFQVKQQNTVYFDANGLTTDYYKVQWKNSQTGDLSDLSTPISVASDSDISVANAIVNPVLSAMGVSPNDPKINAAFLINAVDEARVYVKDKLFGINHSWQQEFEWPIKMLAGTNFIYLPDDIEFKNDDRSLLATRFLIANMLTPFNLKYIDKRTWNQVSFQITGSKTSQPAIIGDTSLFVENVGDFYPQATGPGVAYVATTAFDQIIMQIQYTAVDPVTNELLGVTGIDRNIPDGTQVWCQPTISQPIYYTVWENMIVFDRIIPDSMQGNNCYIDWYRKVSKITSLSQDLPEPYRGIYKSYLRFAIKYRKDITTPANDPDYVKFEELVKALFDNLYTGQITTIETS